jgi:ATP-dependent Clp protease ATP-binding subunit ClpA
MNPAPATELPKMISQGLQKLSLAPPFSLMLTNLNSSQNDIYALGRSFVLRTLLLVAIALFSLSSLTSANAADGSRHIFAGHLSWGARSPGSEPSLWVKVELLDHGKSGVRITTRPFGGKGSRTYTISGQVRLIQRPGKLVQPLDIRWDKVQGEGINLRTSFNDHSFLIAFNDQIVHFDRGEIYVFRGLDLAKDFDSNSAVRVVDARETAESSVSKVLSFESPGQTRFLAFSKESFTDFVRIGSAVAVEPGLGQTIETSDRRAPAIYLADAELASGKQVLAKAVWHSNNVAGQKSSEDLTTRQTPSTDADAPQRPSSKSDTREMPSGYRRRGFDDPDVNGSHDIRDILSGAEPGVNSIEILRTKKPGLHRIITQDFETSPGSNPQASRPVSSSDFSQSQGGKSNQGKAGEQGSSEPSEGNTSGKKPSGKSDNSQPQAAGKKGEDKSSSKNTASTSKDGGKPFVDILQDDRLRDVRVVDEVSHDRMALSEYIEKHFDVIQSMPERPFDFVNSKADIDRALAGLSMRQGGGVRITGRPGTGKSYRAETIISYILNSDLVPAIKDTVIIRLTASSLSSNTDHRGQFESRVQALKLLASKIPVTLWIDELHTLVGQGTYKGSSIDFFQHIKTLLAEARIKVIGTTTDGEWEKYFSGDSALAQRFPVHIKAEEPTRAEILVAVENFLATRPEGQGPKLSRNELEMIYELANRFDPIDANPRKSIRLADYAAARGALDRVEVLAPADITRYASELYGYDISKLTIEHIRSKLANLDQLLSEKMVGLESQNLRVSEILASHFLNQARGDSFLPTAFLEYGEAGTGKSQFPKEIARSLGYGFTRIMLADFQGFGDASKFAARLAQAIRTNPFQVILLDEVEKAPKEVQNILLRVLDEGRFEANLSIVEGKNNFTEIDASKVILIGATNAARELASKTGVSASEFETAAIAGGVEKYFLDRFVEFIPFSNYTKIQLAAIFDMNWRVVEEKYKKLGLELRTDVEKLREQILAKLMSDQSSQNRPIGFIPPKSGSQPNEPSASGARERDSEAADNEPIKLSVRAMIREIARVVQRADLFALKNPEAKGIEIYIEGAGETALASVRAFNGAAESAHKTPRQVKSPTTYQCRELFR